MFCSFGATLAFHHTVASDTAILGVRDDGLLADHKHTDAHPPHGCTHQHVNTHALQPPYNHHRHLGTTPPTTTRTQHQQSARTHTHTHRQRERENGTHINYGHTAHTTRHEASRYTRYTRCTRARTRAACLLSQARAVPAQCATGRSSSSR